MVHSAQVGKYIALWNGDEGCHIWPELQSFIVFCSPLSLVLRMMKTSIDAEDVQHFIFDEVHEASSWQLFLISYFVEKMRTERCFDRKLYLVSATPQTPVYRVMPLNKLSPMLLLH